MSSTVLIGQAPTNLGPLTTTFTPPAACTVAVGAGRGGLGGLIFGSGSSDVACLGQACSLGQPVDATSCWPSTSKGAPDKQGALHGWGYYSPGLHCPVGYATACSATGGSGGGSGWPVQFKLRDGETAVGCCPSGYGCANINGQTCTMVATSTTIPTVTCDGSKSGDFAFQTIPDAQASITALSLFAPLIQINWQSSDRPSTASPTATTTHTTTGAQITAAGTQTIDTGAASTGESLILDGNTQPTATRSIDIGAGAGLPTTSTTAPLQDGSSSNTDDNDGSGSKGFTPGAKVAVGVAGAVGFIMVVVCSLFYCWRRRMHKREEQEMDRLYGYGGAGGKHAMSAGGDFTSSRDIPGWYRGQRLATPAKDAVWDRGGVGGGGGLGGGVGVGEVEVPDSTYYRGYRR